MNLLNTKYIIVELIPTSVNPEKGKVIQISALKLNGLILEDRFDYRLSEEKILINDLKEMLNYDKDSFIYKNNSKDIMKAFQKWALDLPILFIDNKYTENYLSNLDNKKESIFNYLGMNYSDDVIDKLIKKYNLEPSNYIVDLLYESLINEIK